MIADKVGLLADYYFNGIASGAHYSCLGLWFGSIAYSLQLYYDFSGYSDIAIGIGKMLGFDICENFDHPYLASNISSFWRRWHISLSQWFRDYVYIPLGGNRCNILRHIFNLFVVWLLTGLWHGADWTFILWGLAYFILLTCEKYFKSLKGISNHWYGKLYTLFFVNILWVLFRAINISSAHAFIAGMFGIGTVGVIEEKAIKFIPLIIFSAFLCTPYKETLIKALGKKSEQIHKAIIVIVFFLSICAIANASYTPYIYGNF